jgi:hypothetical protein
MNELQAPPISDLYIGIRGAGIAGPICPMICRRSYEMNFWHSARSRPRILAKAALKTKEITLECLISNAPRMR